MITKIRVTATVIAILILILCPIVVNAKLTPKEGVTIFDLLPALKGEDSLQGEPPTRRRHPCG